jgi:molecular chaperone GrpE
MPSRDREEARRLAEESVILDVISVMDDLDRAIEAARGAEVEDSWVAGFELVATRLRDALSRRGVSQLDPMGAPFDPEFHEALLEIDAPEGAAPGDVVQVALKGYARDGRALRAARVVVARETPGGD